MITTEELVECLTLNGVRPEAIRVVDQAYSLPDEAAIVSMGKRFADFLFANGVKAQEEAFDCDDFARTCAGMFRLDHALHNGWLVKLPEAQETNPPQRTALGFGVAMVFYETYGHALNIAVLRIGGKLVVKLYEPQPINGICLSESSLESVQFWSSVEF